MNSTDLADHLLERATVDEQVAYRVRATDDVPELRRIIRRLARERSIRIRTAVLDDVLAVVRADAAIWNDAVATMKMKLKPALTEFPLASVSKGVSQS